MLTWALCVATINRIGVLEQCVALAAGQTRPPSEVVICDASADWQAHRERIGAVLADRPDIRLVYLEAAAKSGAFQRNQCIEAARADVLFLIDDDSLMHADCAERIMAVYDADPEGRIAGVQATETSEPPLEDAAFEARRGTGATQNPGIVRTFMTSALGRFLWEELFLNEISNAFVAYDRRRAHRGPSDFGALADRGLVFIRLMPGYLMTVRRSVAVAEPFEPALLGYSPGEDLDVSYRFTRHGLNVQVPEARIYHFQAQSGVLRRRTVTALHNANLAFFVKRNSDSLWRHAARYYLHMGRRLVSEGLKDLLGRRWRFPQLRGILAAIGWSVPMFRHDPATVADWYKGVQQEILKGRE